MCDELMGGGVLNMYGAIIVDLIAFLTCKRAISVNGMLRTYARQTEHINGHRLITSDDFCSFQMELNDDACATVTVNGNVAGPYYQEVLSISMLFYAISVLNGICRIAVYNGIQYIW